MNEPIGFVTATCKSFCMIWWHHSLICYINKMPFTPDSLINVMGYFWFIVANRLNISKDWKWISYWSFTGLGRTLQTVICEVWRFSWLKKLNYCILLRLISEWCSFILSSWCFNVTYQAVFVYLYLQGEILNWLLSKRNRLKTWSSPSLTTWQPRYHLFVTVSTHIPPPFHPLILSHPLSLP